MPDCQTLATGEFQVQSKESLPKDSLAVLFPLMTLPDSLDPHLWVPPAGHTAGGWPGGADARKVVVY